MALTIFDFHYLWFACTEFTLRLSLFFLKPFNQLAAIFDFKIYSSFALLESNLTKCRSICCTNHACGRRLSFLLPTTLQILLFFCYFKTLLQNSSLSQSFGVFSSYQLGVFWCQYRKSSITLASVSVCFPRIHCNSSTKTNLFFRQTFFYCRLSNFPHQQDFCQIFWAIPLLFVLVSWISLTSNIRQISYILFAKWNWRFVAVHDDFLVGGSIVGAANLSESQSSQPGFRAVRWPESST